LLQEDFITKLIDLKDAQIENVKHSDTHIYIDFSMKRMAHTCPRCACLTERIHDYRIQKIKDLPIQGKHVILHYRKRRYSCPCCGKKFYETLYLVPKRHRITNRVALYSTHLLKNRISIKDAANSLGVSSSSVSRWFKLISFPPPRTLPKVLSIDEFKGNAWGEKFQCILTDLKKRDVFDILPTRKQEDLLAYFSSFKDKSAVKYFVMDMNKSYQAVASLYFPQALIVIDKFHVARYCTWAFENVRKRVQSKLPAYERKYFKRSRKLLIAKMKSLKDEDKSAVERMLSYSVDLKNAYILKEYFYDFMDCKSKTDAQQKLKWFRLQAGIICLDEFERCLNMLENWEKYILNAFECSYSNGFTEGINNSVKVIKRVGFGYRNFDTLRRRILLIHHKNASGLTLA
jgi:transposase